jgi:ADP-heptose:LPS heptosyltransferase
MTPIGLIRPLVLPAWFGEFGWEVMSWAPWCRARSREAGGAVITSFGASRALYADFATQFRDHGGTQRSLDYPKGYALYRSDGPGFEHVRYGNPDDGEPFDVLIHARGIQRKSAINYCRWCEVLAALQGLKVGFIGTSADLFERVTGHESRATCRDLRGLSLDRLMATIAASDMVVGCSSGTMHLASACGCDLVAWGDTKTRYGETLERRYKETWNPHRVRVEWLDADDWQPNPARVVQAIEHLLALGQSPVP